MGKCSIFFSNALTYPIPALKTHVYDSQSMRRFVGIEKPTQSVCSKAATSADVACIYSHLEANRLIVSISGDRLHNPRLAPSRAASKVSDISFWRSNTLNSIAITDFPMTIIYQSPHHHTNFVIIMSGRLRSHTDGASVESNR
jgi:hypothetical protein